MNAPISRRDASPTQQRGAELFAFIADVIGFLGRTAWPVLDIVIRLWIGKQAIMSGLLLAHDWNTAVTLAVQEYPIHGLAPRTEALLGILLQLFGGASLLLGLGTRLGALAIVGLSIATQVYYVPLDLSLFRIALAMGYVLRGPGPLSLDHLLIQGLSRSPVPFAASIASFLDETRAPLGAGYQLALRVWLALALLLASNAIFAAPGSPLSLWLPLRSAAVLFAGAAPLLAVALGAGLATRLTAAVALGASGYQEMMAGADFSTFWTLGVALLIVSGPGALSLDGAIVTMLKRRFPQLDGKPAFSLSGLPRVVIIGAGFGGVACGRALRHTPVQVTLIDRHNYHLFQPLLYQVATAALSPGDIAVPIRSMFRDQFNARVLLGNVSGVDSQQRQVFVDDLKIPYDYLVVATGATHSYFGKEEWSRYAPGLKRVEDATGIRRRILQAFERAEIAPSETERRHLLNFVVVGAGPTGVELAGAIAELARFGMGRDFRNIDPSLADIILVQAAQRILPTFPEKLARHAQQALERLGVTVFVGSRVEKIDDQGVIVNGDRIYSKSVLWAAGVAASPAAKWLQAEADAAGRVKVDRNLAVPHLPNVFVIGDAAGSDAWRGRPVPGLAPAAKQGGTHIARLITARVLGRPDPGPFVYRHHGSLATIGRKSAVADFGWIRLAGAPAWWLWGLVHVAFLVGGRNRLSVLVNWAWSYFTFRANTRLITEVLRDG
ncbi:MAG TPA: NAD(P)/FAD-dependent oxidoreductase [Stellaceae bacterium]|nr:NAD(P)/FAD-dependent oxidoreductase [Stellaceae bacterium]